MDPVTVDPADVATRLGRVRDRIASAGGDPETVTVVAVTKDFGPDAVDAAVAAGLVDVGERTAQELAAKAELVSSSPRWHFVGRLQRNKVKAVAGLVSLWQSVDRLELGEELAKRAAGASLLVQVNVSDEPQKGGCEPAEVATLVAALRQRELDVRGLMTVGHPVEPRPGFRLLRRLADDLGLPERSMGMSGDLEIAVEEGSTMVRVGRALFGERPRPGGTVTVGSTPERTPED